MTRSFRKFSLTTLALTAALAACETQDPTAPSPSFATGNGAPSGAHYGLNLIGVPKNKTADMTGNNGHRIFVQLYGGEDATSLNGRQWSDVSKQNKILLSPGTDFQVTDANATDNNGAAFTLPADVSTTYAVYARALGKPGGTSTMTTCAVDPTTGEIFCSDEHVVSLRTKGKSTFTNVSQELLTANITVDPDLNPDLATCLGLSVTDGDDPATAVRVNLFNPCLESYFWNYQNNGLKLLQLRFYAL
jgi:hypothetical protein